ncbi:hypothetical protein B0H16DRAFT_1449590 [Mycena metata]|uniref:Transferase family protein n=1 Tax=Mycena metata TaxID=1033252 RepID=A0AAD7K5F4_9AGAR|nr:hypothetical protein B0H16DRAFT_1449590 [Mycena metata]
MLIPVDAPSSRSGASTKTLTNVNPQAEFLTTGLVHPDFRTHMDHACRAEISPRWRLSLGRPLTSGVQHTDSIPPSLTLAVKFFMRIPENFSPESPSTAFTVKHYHEPYRSSARPEIDLLLSSSHSEPFICASPSLRDLAKEVEAFSPIFEIHVSVFEDLTLIGITHFHATSDVGGLRTLMHAWARLISGEHIDAIRGIDRDAAPLEHFRQQNSRRDRIFLERDRIVQPPVGSLDDLYLALFPDNSNTTPDLVRVPKVFLEDRRREILEDFKLNGSSESVDSSDVLLAWWFKLSYSTRSASDTTPIFLHISVDLRPLVAVFSAPYINHASSTICIEPPIPATAFRALSLRELALRIHRTIAEYQKDLARLELDLWWRSENPTVPLYRCPPGGEAQLQTDWSQAGLAGMDFSGARTVGSDAKGTGRVVFVVVDSKEEEKGTGEILMEDENAVWISQVKLRKEWEKLRSSGKVEFVNI